MKMPNLISILVALATVLPARAGAPPSTTMDKAGRESVIAAATQALHQHMFSDPATRKGDEIAREFWGEAITALKPLYVRNDHVNIFIVLKEDKTSEEGLYVSNPISSYAPGHDKSFLVFEKLSLPGDNGFGAIYRCKIAKTSTAAPPASNQPLR